MDLSASALRQIRAFQRNETTEYHIYTRLAQATRSPENSRVLTEIAADELRHYGEWKKYSGQEIQPDWPAVWKYYLLGRLFGLTFTIKLMERGEEKAQGKYAQMLGTIPEVEALIRDENAHEQALLNLLDEERLHYAGSVVLGLNDALVELTGALAGFTLALQNVKLIALSGLITGIAAAMSMAASEYLSTRSERTGKRPGRAALYTGVAYILTVTLLILPYLLIENYFIDLGLALATALLIIAAFNYYISITNDEPFRRRFLEMAGLSFGVAAFSFVVGYFIRGWLGI